MADKSIGELIAASQVQSADLFVLEQNGVAKKLAGQILENWLVNMADGHGGIQSVSKTSTSGLTDTYTITYADTTTSTFTVTNGAQGQPGEKTYVWIKYSSVQPTSDSQIYDTPDNWMGIYAGPNETAPTSYAAYKWFRIKGATGDPGAAATISQQSITYQSGTSGTSVPSGTWTTSVPTVPAGNYLWTRTQITFNTGAVVTSYSVGRMGIDGMGTVSTVNSVAPDGAGNVSISAAEIPGAVSAVNSVLPGGTGNVSLSATNIPTDDNTSVQSRISAIENGFNIISDTWNSTTTYGVGDYCIDDGHLWRCLVQNVGQKPDYTSSYWSGIVLTSTIKGINQFHQERFWNLTGSGTSKPWIVIRNNYAQLPAQVPLIMNIADGGVFFAVGEKTNDSYGAFFIISYAESAIWRVWLSSGTWKYAQITTATGTVF